MMPCRHAAGRAARAKQMPARRRSVHPLAARRSAVPKSTTLRHAGQTSWRGLAAYTLAEGLRGVGRETWGAGVRFGFSTVSPEQAYWFAGVRLAHAADDPETEQDHRTRPRRCVPFWLHPPAGVPVPRRRVLKPHGDGALRMGTLSVTVHCAH
jgi:hypothetical protein